MHTSDHHWAARSRIEFLELLDESGDYLNYLIMHYLAKIELKNYKKVFKKLKSFQKVV